MSPLDINILLHVYAISVDYRDAQLNQDHAKSEAVRQTFRYFERAELIEQKFDDDDWNAMSPADRPPQFIITTKGEAMVEAICAVQIPICKWVQP